MKKTTDELLREYEAQCGDSADAAESKALCCCSSDDSYECCQLCSCLACTSCCDAAC